MGAAGGGAARTDRLLPAYRALWAGLAKQSGLHALSTMRAEALDRASSSTADGSAMGEVPEDWLVGFHDVEEYDGERFRWSGPLAALKLPLELDRYLLRIRTRGLRRGVRLRAFLNGRPLLVHDCQSESGEIRLALRRTHFRKTRFQYLVLLCEPLRPWLHGVPDRRELRLPVFGVSRSAPGREVPARDSGAAGRTARVNV